MPPHLISPSAVQEEWTDADFDLSDGQAIHTPSEKDDDDDDDWDVEMAFGNTGSAKIQGLFRSDPSFVSSEPKMNIFRRSSVSSSQDTMSTDDDDDDEEGLSTIKMPLKLAPPVQRTHSPIDEDFEEGFSLPSDLTRLSLAPLSLSHRVSKQSLEWEDKDHTTSSQSSDAYSTLGFADASPSSISSASVSTLETEDECEDDLDGLVIPAAIFDSGHGGQHLSHLLALKKIALDSAPSSSAISPNPEDDFEMGLVIDDDVVLSPSRLLQKSQQKPRLLRRMPSKNMTSVPPPKSSTLRPPSRVKYERSKSPTNFPPQASAHQLQKLRLSPPPSLRGPTRSQTFQAFHSPAPSPSGPSFFSPKPGSLRGQKSHSGLLNGPVGSKNVTRKASLSSLMEPPPHASGSTSPTPSGSASSSRARYDQPTAASRAKTQHKASTNRLHQDYQSPSRSSTPSSNSAQTTTLPTAGRFRIRTALSSVFGGGSGLQSPRTASPLPPPRPPSNLSKTSRLGAPPPPPAVPKVLRKPKRVRTYGDGTELDAIEDLPTDRDKESRFRVQAKGYGNRIPGGTYASKVAETPAVRKPTRRERSESAATSPPSPLRRSSKNDLSMFKTSGTSSPPKKKVVASPTSQTKRKPTLIRNLGRATSPKVVGNMKWNPQTSRWEGNDHVLREFDAVVTSTRPALITHLSGASMGSPVLSLAAGARKVGNMIFDPARMCWISTLPPEEEEPDVFANLADDEEDDWETKGGTIRANVQLVASSTSNASIASTVSVLSSPSRQSHCRSPSECGSERGSRASLMCSNVDEAFLARCRVAEERHRKEMSGWVHALAVRPPSDASFLYEIRALATRKY